MGLLRTTPGCTKMLATYLCTLGDYLAPKVDFPADVGASCHTWEQGNHPECKGKSPASWCSQAWCVVDPCSCKLATPPKTSVYFPESKYQGKPIYYSYATCGGTDSYTAGRKEACVNQQTADDCVRFDKCASTGKECLGKELASVCKAVDADAPATAPTSPKTPSAKSLAWAPQIVMSLALPLLSLFY
jgi:hypothetical protein